jgi:hypothetical protein
MKSSAYDRRVAFRGLSPASMSLDFQWTHLPP